MIHLILLLCLCLVKTKTMCQLQLEALTPDGIPIILKIYFEKWVMSELLHGIILFSMNILFAF